MTAALQFAEFAALLTANWATVVQQLWKGELSISKKQKEKKMMKCSWSTWCCWQPDFQPPNTQTQIASLRALCSIICNSIMSSLYLQSYIKSPFLSKSLVRVPGETLWNIRRFRRCFLCSKLVAWTSSYISFNYHTFYTNNVCRQCDIWWYEMILAGRVLDPLLGWLV